jgi:N-methylhydantoinase B/oxoprolinase/acetone carboxylase alpha subunit
MMRPVEKVLEDVKQGFVTVRGAQKDYGVKVDRRQWKASRVQDRTG